MTSHKTISISPSAAVMIILAASLISSALTASGITRYYNQNQFHVFASIYQDLIDQQPQMEQTVLKTIKSYKQQPAGISEDNVLLRYGYTWEDFFSIPQQYSMIFIAAGFLAGSFLVIATLNLRKKNYEKRIRSLTAYLEQVNTGRPGLLTDNKDDSFSGLQDEIYKTVTYLCQTRDNAVRARESFAENLANIAHQLKTPITAISLSLQMVTAGRQPELPGQIKKQLDRLTYLEEVLLLLARIDNGTLPFEQTEVDIFTALTLAADNLEELLAQKNVSVEIPEAEAVTITGDPGWTMEAFMNLLKNCMEHAPAGSTIHCSYEQNPLCSTILIRDEGEGFAARDLPHLFERFYRGEYSTPDGIGIGLALSKAIFEKEQGIITAANHPGGGACFEIRIYSH